MENNTNLDNILSSYQSVNKTTVPTLLSGVFSWMFLALIISAVFAYVVGENPVYHALIMNPETGRMMPLGWLVTLLPFGLVLLLSFGYQKLNFVPLALIFVLYSVLMGISLSTLFVAYSLGSIGLTFGISAITFGIMAITGYTTKTDLTKIGNILFMGLLGIILASLVNMFLHSSGLQFMVSIAGVAIFTGLTAYDVQKIKNLGIEAEASGMDIRKLSIMGALTLYLDFVNLFILLLQFFGRRK